MKRQLDRLKGKRLVTGDPNLMTKDEICINATPNGVEVKEIGTDGKIKDLAGSGDNGGGSSEGNENININQVYESNKVCWKVNDPVTEEALELLSFATLTPIYSSIIYDGGDKLKTYGHYASIQFLSKLETNNSKNYVVAFEETKINKLGDATVNENDVFLSVLETTGLTETDLNALGIYKISYEEYLNIHDKEVNLLEFK